MESNLIYFQSIILLVLNLFFFINKKKIFNYINIIDTPDGKIKLHKKKIYPIGGVIFFFNLLIFIIIEALYKTDLHLIYGVSIFDKIIFLFSITSLFFVGLYDDKYNLNYIAKLILTSLIVFIFVSVNENFIISKLSFTFTDKIIYINEISKFFTIICILLFINALNLFDGIDLQSGSYILIIFVFFFILLNIEFLIILILSCIFFLYFNYKREIFLGDSGTILIGFIISCLSIYSYNSNLILSDQIFILMMVPGIDMIRLFLVRIVNGRNPFKGDRNHMHHILIKKYSFTKSFVIINFTILTLIVSNLFFKISILLILPAYLIFYFLMIYEKKTIK